MSVDIHDVITCATFCDDRLRGLGVARGRISRFPIDLRRRPYNTRTTVRVGEHSLYNKGVHDVKAVDANPLRVDCDSAAVRLPFD